VREGRDALLAALEPRSREALERAVESHLRGGRRLIQAELRLREGGSAWLDVRGAVVALEEGAPSRLAGTVASVAERKDIESRLESAQRLETIGTLAAGIAHEINTPTQYVGDNVRFLEDSFDELVAWLERTHEGLSAIAQGRADAGLAGRLVQEAASLDLPFLRAEIPSALSQSQEGIAQIARIVHAMKEFSHPGTEERRPVDLNGIIDSAVVLSRNEWKYAAELELELAPDLPPVPCLPGDISQVILNLVVNAAHAVSDAGRRPLKGKGAVRGRIRIATRLDGAVAEIRVEDDGVGIPEELQERIFDPFFTTKEVGRGTGQGLAIARSVVAEKHGGRIAVSSEVGRGSCFRVRLPLGGGGERR
jgi:signal transduction histidine kinase